MPDYPQEGALRGGHIPGAASIPWARAAAEDGTFKTARRARGASTSSEQGLDAGDDVVAYCRIGERSSHTWFVLTYLLGFDERAQLRRLAGPSGATPCGCPIASGERARPA